VSPSPTDQLNVVPTAGGCLLRTSHCSARDQVSAIGDPPLETKVAFLSGPDAYPGHAGPVRHPGGSLNVLLIHSWVN